MQRYDAQNSYVTLGNQLMLANQMLQQLMVSESTFDRIESIEELVGLLEGMLSSYYPFMSLTYFDVKENKMVTFKNYETAMKHLTLKLKENSVFVEDKMTRGRYIYWLNRKYQLLSSCYGKLKLVPELSGGADMGAVEDEIPEEVSNIPDEEYIDEQPIPVPVKPKVVAPRPLSPLEKIKKEYEEKIAKEEAKMKKGSADAEEDDDADFELEDEPPAE